MTENNILVEKTIAFSIRIIKCYKYLTEEKKEAIMSKQLFRSGTSIGANVHEGIQAQSRADFVNKLNVALKEASESSYWITLLHETEYIDDRIYLSTKKDVDEIIRLLIASIKTTKKNGL